MADECNPITGGGNAEVKCHAGTVSATTTNSRQSDDLSSYPLILLVVPAAILLGLFMQHIVNNPTFLNHDCAFLLHGARLLMDGKVPFVDFVDMVPPLAFYSFIPIWTVSKLTAISIELTWSITCWCIVLLATVAGIMVARNSTNWRVNDWLSLGPLFASFLLLNLVFLYHTGQREYLFVVTFFVLFLIRWQRSLGNSVNSYVAGVAGVACSFTCFVKPQLLIVVVLLELYWLLFTVIQFQRQRYMLRKAPEMVAGVTTYVLYFLASFFIPNINLYYSRWIPLVTKGYASFNQPVESTLLFATNFGQIYGDRLLVGCVLVTALVMIRRTTLIAPLLLWTFAAWLVYLIQGKGWAYHSIPLVAGYFLVSAVTLSQLAILLLEWSSRFVRQLAFLKPCFTNAMWSYGVLFQPWKNDVANGVSAELDTCRTETNSEVISEKQVTSRQILSRLAVLVFLLYGTLLLPTSGNLIHDSTASGTVLPVLDGIVESETKPGDSIMVIATNFSAIYPMVVHKDRRQSTRYMWCFNFPMLLWLQHYKDGVWKVELSRFLHEIEQDIIKTRPRLIAIEARCPWPLHQHLFGNKRIESLLADHFDPLGDYNGFAIWKLKPTEVMPDKNRLAPLRSEGAMP